MTDLETRLLAQFAIESDVIVVQDENDPQIYDLVMTGPTGFRRDMGSYYVHPSGDIESIA